MPGALSLIRSDLLRHAEYADAAVVAEGSELVLLAGACPPDADGRTTAPGDLAAQTRRALANLDTALAAAGVGLADVAFLRVLVATTRAEDLGTAWGLVREHLGPHQPPGTLHGVTVLGYPDQLVELEAVAARASARYAAGGAPRTVAPHAS